MTTEAQIRERAKEIVADWCYTDTEGADTGTLVSWDKLIDAITQFALSEVKVKEEPLDESVVRRIDPNSDHATQSGAVDGHQRQVTGIAGAVNTDGASVVILVLDDKSRVGLWPYHRAAITKCASELP